METSSLMIHRNAVRVFPVPVGELTRTFFPSAMRGMA